MKEILEKIAQGERNNGAFQARTNEDIEDIDYLYSLGYVNKFDFMPNGCAATLTSKGSQELKRLQNA